MIRNVHSREVPGGGVVDRVVELWPSESWPRLRLDRPLAVGATGGHSFVRYTCTEYLPGRRVEFTFAPGVGLVGTHVFEAVPGGIRHTVTGRAVGWMRLGWPLAVRWLHDALIEDMFDKAARTRRAHWSPWVRILRRVLTKG
ncbi:SRPBCC family protein [Saccharothrix obliqua]|uniref:SRPBCC family protein n=1 Tax=Saccharothrix obliqua TaxID=2861747 RepID=UPI001C5F5879|nr:SRPBCC family protein [Saccharothrix obliqua]MBW4720098.1 SRPBCC family protein [Saccharothrix obliqua]